MCAVLSLEERYARPLYRAGQQAPGRRYGYIRRAEWDVLPPPTKTSNILLRERLTHQHLTSPTLAHPSTVVPYSTIAMSSSLRDSVRGLLSSIQDRIGETSQCQQSRKQSSSHKQRSLFTMRRSSSQSSSSSWERSSSASSLGSFDLEEESTEPTSYYQSVRGDQRRYYVVDVASMQVPDERILQWQRSMQQRG